MLEFSRLRWRNLLSYGNTWSEVELNRNSTTVITGKNGGGKSAFYEALHINLFGQSIRSMKKGQWLNNKNNKGMETESHFRDNNGDEIVVRRCVKPDEFSISRNGVAMNQEASVREMQNILNRDILGTDKVGFQITTLISKSGIQMFMSLKAEERRRFVDNMLGTGVFTEMAKQHKLNADKLKQKIEASTVKVARAAALVEGKESEIETALEMQRSAAQRRQAEHDRQVEELTADIEAAKSRLARHERNTEYGASYIEDVDQAKQRLEAAKLAGIPAHIRKEVDDAEHRAGMGIDENVDVDAAAHVRRKDKVKKFKEILNQLRAKKLSLEGGMDSLKAGHCQACRQDVDEAHIRAERAKLAPKVMEIEGLVEQATEQLESLEKKVADTEETMRHNEQRQREILQTEKELARAKDRLHDATESLDRSVRDAENALADANRRLEGASEAHEATANELSERATSAATRLEQVLLRFSSGVGGNGTDDRISGAKTELKSLRSDFAAEAGARDRLAVDAEYSKLMTAMLKDGGVKSVIVRKFIPIVNTLVNERLAELGFFAKFTMDENFEERIMYNGVQEMTFSQFSEGEKLRINLALILAWRDIARLQGRMNCNLLMFDEVLDGSLDDEGYDSLTEIFKVISDLNVFIISHNPAKMENFVRSKMVMEKVGGFSRIAA